MNGLMEPLLKNESFIRLQEAMAQGKTPVLTGGVIESQKCHLIYALREALKRPVFIITNSELKAKHIHEDLRFFVKDAAKLYPAKDIIFYSADVHSAEIMRRRFEVIDSIISQEQPVVVASVEALFDRLIRREIFENFVQSYSEGQIIEISAVLANLLVMGYEQVAMIEGAGQFSHRGGIVDIYPISFEKPVRIEFWDDEIDSIRIFDLQTQRSIDRIKEIRVIPRREIIYTPETAQRALHLLKKDFERTLAQFEKKGNTEYALNLKRHIGETIEKVESGMITAETERMAGYFYDETVTLLDYLPDNALLFYDDPDRVAAHAANVTCEFEESIANRIEKGYMMPEQAGMLFDYGDILRAAGRFSQCLLVNIQQRAEDFTIAERVEFYTRQVPAFANRVELLAEDLKGYKQRQYRTLILGGPRARCERFVRELNERGTEAFFLENPEQTALVPGGIAVTRGSIHHGFEYANEKFIVISDKEIFGEEGARRRPKKKTGAVIESFTDLKVGDCVVHQTHGVGIYKGIEKTAIEGITKDFIKIEYADGGMIGVSVNQLDLIQKYIGSEGNMPRLNKLGGQDWERAKAKAKAAVKILAQDLIDLYAKRQAATGFSFSPDTLWQTEFEETFPFEETEDQLNAIDDVKRDMQSPRVMDRLICGDVGYGKTEIAIRAAFKCVQDGKQVAYLVPTTILAQQHYNTFTERMADYPIGIEMLSRFRTASQQKKIVEDIKKGTVDIVIATHRIISKDIEFRDLGLVIIDEEQRFGVGHKEKLKKLKESVDVLTLTATPIPRTLHMSITGIRDLSLLEEPPLERRPVQTYVMEYDRELIRDAVHRELARNGQVYYLHNRVKNIAETAIKLQKLVPEARVAFAHGQMGERELENIMVDFINGEIDVLVCTTIVETGLDIPNVNTIIIQDADHMGLSQLYQLRGRVGRSNRIAYAYLCYRKDKMLNEIAEKRLQTIKEFTEFGSGFKIAMRDLEIRGAGNLLGGEQHGHMESVGYDMYCKLLAEAVKISRGEEVAEDFETAIDISMDAYIPERYIESEVQRLMIYKKISQIITEDDYFDVQEEIEDRYGTIPIQIQNLLEVAILKSEAHQLDVISVIEKNDNLVITFKNDAKINPAALAQFVQQHKKEIFFTVAPNPYLTVRLSQMRFKDKTSQVSYIKNMLQELKGLNSA